MNLTQPPSGAPIARLRGVSKVYLRGQERVEALQSIDLDIQPGEFTLLIGPSGGGKSTLLHLLGAIDQPTSGEIEVAGLALQRASEASLTRFRREHIGFVFQFYNLLPSIDARENVALPLLARGLARREALPRAEALLAEVGLAARSRHKPAQLSGGEQQRVAIARAIAANPPLVLADEPTGDLDSAAADAVMALMRGLHARQQTTFIVATHNERLAQPGDRRLELRSGILRELP